MLLWLHTIASLDYEQATSAKAAVHRELCTLDETGPALCDGTHAGTELTESSRGLHGTLPTSLGTAELHVLDLATNRISGTLPTEIGRLTHLKKLLLHDNLMSGTLPSELGQLTALTHLYVQGNLFSGSLPSELGLLNPAFCYLLTPQSAQPADAGDRNRFACPLPKLSAGCSQNGLGFAARDAHDPAATCDGAELDGKLAYFPSSES
jgi:hypothetical protein